MKRLHLLAAAVPAGLLASFLLSSASGVTPGTNVASDAAQQGPSCTACHSGTIGSNGVRTRLTAQHHSIGVSETVSISIAVAGGPPSGTGGFTAECSDGYFISGVNTRTTSGARLDQYASHTNFQHRGWTLRFAAPATPGLVELWTVGMSSNGDGTSGGDSIAFHGFDGTAATATPVYIGVNAPGNTRYGQGCVGSYGNWATLYSETSPTLGNQNYAVKLAGATPNTAALFMFGFPSIAPIPLGDGCGLWLFSLADLILPTSGGDPVRGEGQATASLAIPNLPALRGATLACQAAYYDPQNGRALPYTTTSGLLITVQ